MTYNTHSAASTLTPAERSKESLRLLDLLAEVDKDELERAITARALEFLQEKWMEQSLLEKGQELRVSEQQYFWLQDLWAKFA